MKSCCGDKPSNTKGAVEVFDPAAAADVNAQSSSCCQGNSPKLSAQESGLYKLAEPVGSPAPDKQEEQADACCTSGEACKVETEQSSVESCATGCCASSPVARAASSSTLYALAEPATAANASTPLFVHASANVKVDESRAPTGERRGQFERFSIAQMCCPTEQTMIEAKLKKVTGIHALEFNMMNRTMGVWHELADSSQIVAAIHALGMQAVPAASSGQGSDSAAKVVAPNAHVSRWWTIGLAGIAAVFSEVLHFTAAAPEWVVALMALLAIALGGPSTYKKGWISLRNLNLNINALMSIAVTGAALIGQWPEAAMVMVLFTLAERVEARSLDRARNAIKGLIDLTPDRATVQQHDGSWREVEVKGVELWAIVRVRPGERIGLDGEVISGSSAVNQAPITGESLPVDKTVGDPVYAGTVNESGSVEYRVTAKASDTTLARIIHAVEEAQNSRAPTQRFVDRFARIYTPAVFFFAVAIAVVPPLFMAGVWTEWIYRALVLLVVACPCALVISTPVTIVSGLTAATRKGILVKGGIYLELGAKLSFIAFDKTGTLTHGKPVQTDYRLWGEVADVSPELIAASLAVRSDHPVSQAIAKAASDSLDQLADVEQFEALPGRGIQGVIGGHLYYLGNYRLVSELSLTTPILTGAMDALEREGKTVVALLDTQRVLAIFGVADTIKPSSQKAIEALHQLGIKTAMLSGDNEHTAEAIGRSLGIDQARGNLLPADKLDVIGKLQKANHIVGMVGDGINDSPALAKSQIGFAMGAAGTGTAIETADVALMDDDLRKVPAFVQLSRDTVSILKQNIYFALGIKALFLTFTLMGLATMWMAVFADVGVSLLVVLNGLRLLKK
ncbi:putative cadmium-transporting ATPase [Pseudomonas sp. URMO17WK12:I11]|nr:putative cadmium-transporting ATPase [Pseudomonas sp. URMO17WK12:I11]